MRILMLLENNPYPQDVRVRHEANSLLAAGHHVSIVCPLALGQPKRESLGGLAIYRYPAPPAGASFLGYLWEYGFSLMAAFLLSLRVLWREGIDVVHAHNPPDILVLVAAFYKLLGKAFVYDQHDLAPELYHARFGGAGSRLVCRVLILFEKLSCRLADRVIATNESYKLLQMERGRVSEARISIVRNGPVLAELAEVKPRSELQRAGEMVIGYVGVMGMQDGIDYLIRALQHLVRDLGRSDFRCLLVGAGDALASLRLLAEQLGIADRLLFTGWVQAAEVPSYLSIADICVVPDPSNPYNDRSTMVKIMEYMALSKPVVAFDLPEHRFTAQAAAVYALPNDELDLAVQINALMDDPELCQRMGLAGRKRVETELAWEHQEKSLLAMYEELDRRRNSGGA